MVRIHEHRHQLERHCRWTRLNQLLGNPRCSYEGLVSKGSSVLPYVDLDSWGEIPSKHEILHVQQPNVIISIFYVTLDLPDHVLWWKLTEFWVDYLFHWNVLLTVCLPLDAIFHVDRKTQMSQGNNFVIKKEMAKHLPCAVDGCHVEGMMRFWKHFILRHLLNGIWKCIDAFLQFLV